MIFIACSPVFACSNAFCESFNEYLCVTNDFTSILPDEINSNAFLVSLSDAAYVVTIEIFDLFWDRVKFGYAAAEGVVLFIILNVLPISQYVIFRKRLNYD